MGFKVFFSGFQGFLVVLRCFSIGVLGVFSGIFIAGVQMHSGFDVVFRCFWRGFVFFDSCEFRLL